MPTLVATEKFYTLEDSISLPADGKRYELWEGKLVEIAAAREDHSRIGSRLIGLLFYFVAIQNDLGDVYGPDSTFDILGHGLSPDVAFVAKGRLFESQCGMAVIPLVPDLAVEVKSAGDTFPEVKAKVKKYQQAGVRLIWMIVPGNKTVQVYRSGDDKPQKLGVEQELSGEEVISGFTVKVSKLFEHS